MIKNKLKNTHSKIRTNKNINNDNGGNKNENTNKYTLNSKRW